MPFYKYIQPADQPSGKFRLIDWLDNNFQSSDYSHFYCLSAFAKIKPFLKLHNSIQAWNLKGNTSAAVFGVDHKGTSLQALQYALANFDEVQILHVNFSTFHPKMYIFTGTSKASVYYGSGNFTTGGLETNFEGGIITDFDLPAEQAQFDQLFQCYSSIASSGLPCVDKLTPAFLSTLNSAGFLLDETKRQKSHASASPAASYTGPALFGGGMPIKPARAIPKNVMAAASSSAGIVMNAVKNSAQGSTASAHSSGTPSSSPVVVPIIASGFVIQVAPHHNGEIHLSMAAVRQNPAFFGFPFTGTTVPKKAKNSTYPQRDPDPVVNIRVFDKHGNLINAKTNYALNTIYYAKRSEIRITITPAILSGLTASAGTYPLMVMRRSQVIGCDYELDFYSEGSPHYQNYLSICNQSLPSGGKSVPRKMGWI